jgi:hypothetical protein
LGGRKRLGHGKKIDQIKTFQARALTCFFASAFVLFLAITFTDCSTKKTAPPTSPSAQLQAISPADPQKFPSAAKQWNNPYLIIRPDRVGLLSNVSPNEEQVLKPEEALNALAQLPSSAWPYGRVVAILVDEKSAGSEQSRVALRRNRGIVEGDLDEAHVAIRWMGGE